MNPLGPNLLALDTSTETLSVSVQRAAGAGNGNATVWTHSGPGGAQASATLIPAINSLMQQAGLGFSDLDAVVFGAGPGSFTGLRTACSVAQGLAFGAAVPVLPVCSLLAVAEEARFQLCQPVNTQAADAPLRVVALLDARMGEWYCAVYLWAQGAWAVECGPCLIRPENLGDIVAANEPTGTRTVLAGNVFADDAPSPIGATHFVIHQVVHALPTASAMLRLAPAMLQAGQAVPAEQALPIYIRDKVAQTTQERLLAKAAA